MCTSRTRLVTFVILSRYKQVQIPRVKKNDKCQYIQENYWETSDVTWSVTRHIYCPPNMRPLPQFLILVMSSFSSTNLVFF